MAKINAYKPITVREHAVQSVKEAGLFEITVPDGTRAVFIANAGFPHFDKGLRDVQLRHIKDVQPGVIFLMGHMGDSGAFQAIIENEKNFLHTYADSEPVTAAREHPLYEGRVRSLGAAFGDFIKGYAEAAPNATVIWIPAWVKLGLPNELDILDWVHQKKRFLDSWVSNHPDSVDAPSNPFDSLPETLEGLFSLEDVAVTIKSTEDPALGDQSKRIKIMPFGAGVVVNGETLVIGGSFRRRAAGDAPWIEWEQRGYKATIRSVDGKAGSAYQTSLKTTVPEPIYNCIQVHEIGYGWEAKEYGHLGDYHRRCQAFLSGSFFYDTFFGDVVPFLPGADGRRTLYLQGRTYTEETAGGKPNGGKLTLWSAPAEPASTPKPAAKRRSK
jgi:hypothetical protein